MEALDIRHFKLMNGEEIVALVSVKNNDNWIVERPVTVHANLAGGYSFAPWFPFSDAKTFKILKKDIVQHVGVADTIKETYVNYALQLSKPQQPDSPKSDDQILQEIENRLYNQEEEITEDIELGKKTIH